MAINNNICFIDKVLRIDNNIDTRSFLINSFLWNCSRKEWPQGYIWNIKVGTANYTHTSTEGNKCMPTYTWPHIDIYTHLCLYNFKDCFFRELAALINVLSDGEINWITIKSTLITFSVPSGIGPGMVVDLEPTLQAAIRNDKIIVWG